MKEVTTLNPQENTPETAEMENGAEAQTAALIAERDQLATDKAELQDRLLRARAEFDNFRRRSEQQRGDYLQFAAMDPVRVCA